MGKSKPKLFLQRGSSQVGGAVNTNRKPDTTCTSIAKDLLQRAGTMNSIVDPQKGNITSVVVRTYVRISCRKFNKKQCTLYSNSHSTSTGSTKPYTTHAITHQLLNRPVTPSGCQLAEGYIRPLDVKHHSRLQDRFWVQPKQSHPPRPLHFSQKETTLLHTEIHKLLKKQAIFVVTLPFHQDFISSFQKRWFSQTSNKFTSA